MNNPSTLTPPGNTPDTPPPGDGTLVTPEILYLNQGGAFRMAEAFAGTGNPSDIWRRLVLESPDAILYMRELEMKDEDVGDAVAEVKLSVSKRTMQVLPADEHNSLAIDIALFVEAQLKGLANWRNNLDSILDAPFYGYSVMEQIFDQSSGQVALTGLNDCPQELFDFAPIGWPQTGQLRLKQLIGGEGTPVPEQKFVVWSSRPRAGNRKGRALLREVFWPSWFKRNTQRFWMKKAEKGAGIAITKYPQGAERSEQMQALAAAEAISDQTAMAVPENFAVMEELLKQSPGGDPAVYEKLYAALESKIYRRIVGSTLTSHGSDGGKGTQALGDVHEATKEERSVEHTLNLESVINRQIVRQLVWWNFGPDAPMPYVSLDKSNEEDLGKLVTVIDTLQGMGLDIPTGYARTTFGIPAPADGEEVLARPPAPPPPIATPAGAPDKPQFAAAAQAQVDKDLEAFDTLFTQMSAEGREAYEARVSSIADRTHRVTRRD